MKKHLRSDVAVYERKARSCSSCDTPGACCLDEHFVNVRISRLEAVAISKVIERLPAIRRAAVEERVRNSASQLAGICTATFACPLYEKGTGCLVHDEAKPVPCIIHACYERSQDLPPDELQDAAELAIDRLNARVYGQTMPFEALPGAVQAAILRTRRMKAITSPASNQPAT
ncbi:MAG TPA: hypothetical protein VGI80_06760 [Pyrinomonadaceae bacterium]